MNKLPWYLWLIAAAILFIAIFNLPYGYYTFLRISLCAFSILVAFVSTKDGSLAWATAFGMIAILFNPIIPIHLTRSTWFWIDIALGALIFVHLFVVRLRAKDNAR